MKNNKYSGQTALSVLFGMLILFGSCSNILHPASPQSVNNSENSEVAALTVVISASSTRTVFPDAAADIASYRLFGTKAGASEQLAEFAETEKTVSLAAGTWDFLLNAYNGAGEIILQGEAENIALSAGGANRVPIEIAPFMQGKGNIEITIDFPESAGITRVDVSGDLGSQSFNIDGGDNTFTWERSGVSAAWYFASFTLYRGSDKAAVISEIIQVSDKLTSRKTIKLSGSDLKAQLFTQPEGATLAAKLEWLETNAAQGGNYLLYVNANETLAPATLYYDGKSGISITLVGAEQTRTVTLSSSGNILTVGSGVTLLLENNITLKGRGASYSNNAALVFVKNGGTLVMNNGAVITGNTNASPIAGNYGGGINIEGGGTFTMNGGEVSGNSVVASAQEESPFGGGIYAGVNASFAMNGGKISNNSANDNYSGLDISREGSAGGGAYISDNAGFTMNDGEIINNSVSSKVIWTDVYGGGVYIDGSLSAPYDYFIMNGGRISGNTVSADPLVDIYDGIGDNSGTHAYGGGVYVYGRNFTMNGGEITNNSVSAIAYQKMRNISNGVSASAYGGGVYVNALDFTMNGGTVSNNSASAYTDSVNSYNSSYPYEYEAIAHGGGVYTITQNAAITGGEISRNKVSSFREYSGNTLQGFSYGGGIFIRGGSSDIRFVKAGGIITGYTDDTVNGNVTRGINGGVISNQGHAVFIGDGFYDGYAGNYVAARKERSAGTGTDLFYESVGAYLWSGDWDYKYKSENDLPLNTWNNAYLPTGDTLRYSFNVTGGTTYYLWLNDSKEGDGTKTLDVTVDAEYTNGNVICTNVDSAWKTPFTFIPSASGKITLEAAPVNAGETGNFAVMLTSNNDTHTVTFDKNGGDTEAIPRTIDVVKPAMNVSALPVPPEKAGLTFAGWRTRPDGMGGVFNSSSEVTSDITVYAHYIHVEDLTAETYYEGTYGAEEATPVFKFTATSNKQYINFDLSTSPDTTISVSVVDKDFNYVLYQFLDREKTYLSISANPGDVYYLQAATVFDGATYGITVSDHIIRGRQLSAETWAESNIPTAGGEQWFTFRATADTQYIHSSFGTLTDINVQLYDSTTEQPVGSASNLYGNTKYKSLTGLTAGQMYYIKVWPNSSAGSGDYEIMVSGSPVAPEEEVKSLASGWNSGSIAQDGEEWFTFTASAATGYIHVRFGTLASLYVQVYDNKWQPVLSGSDLLRGSTTYQYLTGLTAGQTYYIRVWPSYSSYSGDYEIVVNNSPAPPASN